MPRSNSFEATTLRPIEPIGGPATLLEQSFYDRNRQYLPELLITVKQPLTDDSLESVVAATQPWVRGDHGHNGNDYSFDLASASKLPAYYEQFGLVHKRALPAGHYDQILVFGAVHLGNNKRVRFLRENLEAGVTTDHVVLLGGERKMFPKREPEDIVQNLESLAAKGMTDSWLENFLDQPTRLTDETDMLRIAALDHLGPLALRRQVLHPGAEDRNLSSVPTLRYEFDWQGKPLTLMHTRARMRKDGAARHTTEACVADWVQTVRPADGARVGIICSQPHLERMTKTVLRALMVTDAQVEIISGGPSTTEETGHTIYLGEVARNLYEDLQIATASVR